MPAKKPTVAIIEDNANMANLIQRRLTKAGFDVVGIYASAREAWKALRRNPPDALILDWNLPPGPHGDWVLKQFAKYKLPTRIMVLTDFDNHEVQTQALAGGAHGFVTKAENLAALPGHVQALLAGRFILATHHGEFLRQQVCHSPCAAWQKLSPQQQRIVQLASEGKGNKEIWTLMERSKGTLEEQKRRIFTKLGTRDFKNVIAQCAEALRALPTPLAPAAAPAPLRAAV